MPVVPVRRDIQLCYPFSEERLLNHGRLRSTWTPPYLYHDKLNGERCRVLVQPSRVLLFSSTSEFITTVPHINWAFRDWPPGEYDGELYVHGWTWAEIHSVVSTTMSVHPRSPDMQIHLFDIIDDSLPLIDRQWELQNRYETYGFESPSIHLVRGHVVSNLDSIMDLYHQSISAGYEGFVLKALNSMYIQKDPAYRSPYWMKYKPKKSDTYPLLSIIEAVSQDGQPLGMVGAFLCYDAEGNEFKVGAGKLTHSERRAIWETDIVSDASLHIEYQTLSDRLGVPLFASAVKLILPEDTE